MSARARILIVDDHYVVRQGVRSILTARPEWEVCAEAGNGQEAIQAAMTERPDVVIMDITMPGMSGLEAARRIHVMGLGSAVLVLTMHEFGALSKDIRRVGAKGYVQKARAGRDLIEAIEAVLHGQTFFDAPRKPEPGGRGNKPESNLLHRMSLRHA
jgi:DNA-binding NarL/FixJ family response regulator